MSEDDQSAGHRHHHHHHHSRHYHDDHTHHRHPHHHHHHHHQHHPIEHLHRGEDEMSDHHTSVILSRASSSSLSSSSSSTSRWSSEAGLDDPFTQHRAARPQHSMSCSNIPGGTGSRGNVSADDASESVFYADVKHGRQGGACAQDHRWTPAPRTQLNRRHSRSNEALPQSRGAEKGRRSNDLEPGHLYKTTSLMHSLALCGEEGPKRAVSSTLLPTKGILKARDAQPDIRKARSMEVLSPRMPGKGRAQEAKPQAPMVTAKNNFVQGKLQFSAFLDEITRQVISPRQLNTLGVNNPKCPGQSPSASLSDITQIAPKTQTQLPPKKQKRVTLEEKVTVAKQLPAAGKASSDARSRKVSLPERGLLLNVNRVHLDTPPPQHQDQQHTAGSRRDRPAPNDGPVGDRQGRYGPLLTDGISASTEPSQHQVNQRRHHKHHSRGPSGSPPRQPERPLSSPPPDPDTGSESPPSRSDSSRGSRTREPACASSERTDYHHEAIHRGRRKQHTDSLCDVDQIQVLQEDNADLHQNLLQTVVCIESLEAELQATREELSHIKENYKRLQETHSTTQHTTSLLGEEVHTAPETTGGRECLMQRVSELTEELEKAHNTIASLENTNVHSLVEELLEKHLETTGQPIVSQQPYVQSAIPKAEETPCDWSGGGVRGRVREAAQKRVTAFLPWDQTASGDEAGGARNANQAWFRPVVPQTGPPPQQGSGGGRGGRGGHQSR